MIFVLLTVLGLAALLPADEVRIIRRPPDSPMPATLPSAADVVQPIIDASNAFRVEQGVAELRVDPKLTAAAQKFADYMAQTNRYGHEADGRDPARRAKADKYDFCLIAENIASRFGSTDRTAEEIGRGFVQQWIDSPLHHKNLVDSDMVQLGVGVGRSADGVYFAVQMFGRPQSMVIRFAIRNDTKAPIHYRLDDEGFDLPPRGARQHLVARTPTVRIDGVDEGQQPPKPGTGSRIEVTQDREGRLHVIAQ